MARLAEAHQAGRLQAELTRLGRYPLLVALKGGSYRLKDRDLGRVPAEIGTED